MSGLECVEVDRAIKKYKMRDPYGNGSSLYTDCINDSIPDMIEYYSYLRCYIWENWVKDIFINFLQLYGNLQLS